MHTQNFFFSLQLPAHYYYVYNSSLILTLLSLHAMYKAAPGRSAVFVHVFMHCQICIGNINDECKHEGSAHDSFSFTYFFNYISNHISENMIRIWFTFLKHN